jgi:putative Mg2+ transporter-C (MgtC) family protein
LERQYRQRTAGLRTNVLVAVGAAIFVDVANRLGGHEGAVHVAAYVVSGIGFLGAGVIMREEGNFRGLNTAATLWGSAAVGACAGADLLIEALLATVFVLAANTLLRPVVNRINRKPIDTQAVEATYTVYVISPEGMQRVALTSLKEALEAAEFPIQELNMHAFGSDAVEIQAVFASTSIVVDQLDRVISQLSGLPCVAQALWSPSTAEQKDGSGKP